MSDALAQPVEVGVATLTLPGETESGDVHVLAAFDDGFVLAAIDGLGHGPEAAAAARAAAEVVEARPELGVTGLIEECHRELRQSRGAVMSVASFHVERSEMSWGGVGNVEGLLVRSEPQEGRGAESAMLLGGIVGHNLPPVREATLPVSPGDTLVFASDGIRTSFIAGLDVSGPPQDVAERILASHGKGSDDALVVVARYLGS